MNRFAGEPPIFPPLATKRDSWTFGYTGEALLVACERKIEEHSRYEKEWGQRAKEAETELRDKGIQVDFRERRRGLQLREQEFAGAAFNATYARQVLPLVQIDPERQRHLQECYDKMEEHSLKVLEYEVFRRALELNKKELLPCTVDDIRFFGL